MPERCYRASSGFPPMACGNDGFNEGLNGTISDENGVQYRKLMFIGVPTMMRYLFTLSLLAILLAMSACGNITNGSTPAPTSTVAAAGTPVASLTGAPTAPGGTSAGTAAGATATSAAA